jgi:hypothetical protein
LRSRGWFEACYTTRTDTQALRCQRSWGVGHCLAAAKPNPASAFKLVRVRHFSSVNARSLQPGGGLAQAWSRKAGEANGAVTAQILSIGNLWVIAI